MSEFDVVEKWLAALRGGLAMDGLGEVDLPGLLSMVRAVAHGVSHPAGPVGAFAAGYAAAQAGGSSEAVKAAIEAVQGLAIRFEAGADV